MNHISGSNECELCPLGNSSSGSATACNARVAGRCGDVEFLDSKVRQPGFFQNRRAQAACEICGSGQYTVNDAQTACQMCSIGFCLDCPGCGMSHMRDCVRGLRESWRHPAPCATSGRFRTCVSTPRASTAVWSSIRRHSTHNPCTTMVSAPID